MEGLQVVAKITFHVPVFYFFVNKRELFYNEVMLNAIDNIVEEKLAKAIDEIKKDIRRNNHKELNGCH